ncbi:uncharacterized protein LOC135492404 [Lineus longissimus]|uniref:uncharacterized protein LOC135492404 n=1 Tax=Lineus longissimus TaxID=88925 RepID=UPI002B4E6C7E
MPITLFFRTAIMPRRGKRCNHCDKKNQLMFIESPVNIPHPRLSPVNCAEHPPTAEVVQIDEHLDVPWVSPQFKKYPASCGKKRPSRAKLNEQANATLPRRELPKGFKALKFCGDESTVVENTCENVPCDEGSGLCCLTSGTRLDLLCDKLPDTTSKRIQKNTPMRLSLEHLATQNRTNSRQIVTRSRTKSCEYLNLNDKSGVPGFRETQKYLVQKVQNNPSKRLFSDILNREDDESNEDVNSSDKVTCDKPVKVSKRRHSGSDSSPCRIFFPDGQPLWATPPVIGSHNVKVLVEDTPDAERGLRYKERLWRRLNPNR